jgi:hypothetical protein
MASLTVDCPNAASKASCLVAGMLAGADSIADMDLLRSEGLPDLFDGVRAPSTLGTFPRSFTAEHALQLDKAGHDFLEQLASVVPGLVADTADVWFLDLDDSGVEVHGYHKQAAGRSHSGVNGLNLLNALFSSPGTTQLVVGCRQRDDRKSPERTPTGRNRRHLGDTGHQATPTTDRATMLIHRSRVSGARTPHRRKIGASRRIRAIRRTESWYTKSVVI